MRIIYLILMIALTAITISCQMMTSDDIEGKWKLAAAAGVYDTVWNVMTYEFKNGTVYYSNKGNGSKEVFPYTMSSNMIKISGSETVNGGLADGKYSLYLSGNTMIWYVAGTYNEVYRFERI